MTTETATVESTTQTSPTIGLLAAALAKAQGQIRGALKDSDNPFFKSKYADLASVWEACRQALSANEIAAVQLPSAQGAHVTVTTLLAHSSGEWARSSLTMEAADGRPQTIGSAITYARRYGLAAMVGVAPEDDDGNAAQGSAPTEIKAYYRGKPPVSKAPNGGGMPPLQPGEPDETVLFPSAEDLDTRAKLIKDLKRLGTKLKLSDAAKRDAAEACIGGADVNVCDLAGLTDLVNFLRRRASEPNYGCEIAV